MPQKVVKFTGINRIVNEFQNSGECEELINLRPAVGGGHHVVRSKRKVKEAVKYDEIHEHTFGDTYNQIIVTDGVVAWINDKNNAAGTVTTKFAGKSVSISTAGNVVVIYCEEEKSQLVFKFEDGRYVAYNVAMRPITNASVNYSGDNAFWGAETVDKSTGAMNEALQKAASAFHYNYPNGLCGAAVIGCAYELEDGNEVWATSFIVANAARTANHSKPTLVNNSIVVTGASRVSLRLEFADVKATGVKRLNIYATRPLLPYDVEYPTGGSFTVNELSLEDDLNLGGQLMYYQGSVSIDKSSVSFPLKFGTAQAGEEVMEVNPGCIERTGRSVSYNNRFHYYKSEVRHVLQPPTISNISPARDKSASHWVAYVKINDEWKLMERKFRFSSTAPNDFIYPMAGVKRLAFVKGDWPDGGSFSVPYEKMFYVDLNDSASYNYSYAFDVVPEIVSADDFYDTVRAEGQLWSSGFVFDTKVMQKRETNAINVSAQYNPFVFPVEYSYSFGGEILDVATSYLPISSTQVGQYPLSVFTSNGIYALEQGNGAVLYSNIVPLQPLVIEGDATTCPFGTFFVSSKGLYLLTGRDAANLSYILNGERELTLRELDSYRKLVCSNNGYFFNFEPVLSGEDFEDFIDNAILTYDQLHNELYISSSKPEVPYSYVLNLDTKSYHKVAKRYLRAQNGGRYAIEVVGDDRSVVDMHVEEKGEQPILLQSRPMSLEAFYTHIQRLILLADAKLTDGQHLCLSVFGSDNLYDWKCIISSQKHDTVFRQIRTNRAARSYKDYVILISGIVDTDTDLSDLIADYTVVSRRLG